MRHIFHLIFACLFLISSIPFLPSLSLAKQKIPAADRVKDGQQIDLSQQKYQILFRELINEHQFTQAELDTIFHNVLIKRRLLVLMDTQWEAYRIGRKGLLDYYIYIVEQEQNIALSVPADNRAVTIVGLEIDPQRVGCKRFVAGYPIT